MKIKSRLNKFSSKGFTLIELLIVIAILGILAAAVLVAINPGQRIAAARNARVRADLANMGNLANVYNADSGLYTGTGLCPWGGSYPAYFGQPNACGLVYISRPSGPSGSSDYNLLENPQNCSPAGGTVGPCTSISISGPAYSDGVIDATTLRTWCWRSATGTITQVASNSRTDCAP